MSNNKELLASVMRTTELHTLMDVMELVDGAILDDASIRDVHYLIQMKLDKILS